MESGRQHYHDIRRKVTERTIPHPTLTHNAQPCIVSGYDSASEFGRSCQRHLHLRLDDLYIGGDTTQERFGQILVRQGGDAETVSTAITLPR